MKERIILIGGGGHCKACIDVIEAEGKFKIAGIVDVKEKLHQKVLGYEIVACDEDLSKLAKDYKYFLITIGQIKSADKRKMKFEYLKKIGTKIPVIISPSAYVSKYAFIDEGTVIMHNSFVNAGTRIGKNCIINTSAIIEHGANVGNHCHISLASIVAADAYIGDGVFIGSNSVIINGAKIAGNTVIGTCSLVTQSINKSGTYVGNPANKINEKD